MTTKVPERVIELLDVYVSAQASKWEFGDGGVAVVEERALLSELARAYAVVDAAREMNSWDWPRLLMLVDDPNSKTAIDDAKKLDEAIAALDAGSGGER